MTAEAVIARRRAEQAARIDVARRYAADIPDDIGIRAVVVFGSVARGDFNVWSDIDVLVVADRLSDGYLDRVAAVGLPPTGVQLVVWTPAEWSAAHVKGNPIATEAAASGVVVRGALPVG